MGSKLNHTHNNTISFSLKKAKTNNKTITSNLTENNLVKTSNLNLENKRNNNKPNYNTVNVKNYTDNKVELTVVKKHTNNSLQKEKKEKENTAKQDDKLTVKIKSNLSLPKTKSNSNDLNKKKEKQSENYNAKKISKNKSTSLENKKSRLVNNENTKENFKKNIKTSQTTYNISLAKTKENLYVFNENILKPFIIKNKIDTTFKKYPEYIDSSFWLVSYALEVYPNTSDVITKLPKYKTDNLETKPVTGYAIVFNSTVKRTKKWNFTLGIGYTNIGFENNYLQEITTNYLYEVKDRYRYNFIDLQLGVNYYFSRKRLSIYLNSTPEINFLFLASIEKTNSPIPQYEVPKNSKYNIVANNIMSALNLGIGLDWQLNEYWNIYAQPNYKLSIISYNSSGLIKRVPYSYGVKFGLRYNIYKNK